MSIYSFDNDQLKTNLIPTITASIDNSLIVRIKIVFKIFLSYLNSKSNANNDPPTKRNLMVSLY